ncbi:hypothetical protein [Natronorarus salvus]|uniref:hypothetical protein n=1 Tax=Natronorarus salvus TaxID=3117733 RepID=UPI002F2653BE
MRRRHYAKAMAAGLLVPLVGCADLGGDDEETPEEDLGEEPETPDEDDEEGEGDEEGTDGEEEPDEDEDDEGEDDEESPVDRGALEQRAYAEVAELAEGIDELNDDGGEDGGTEGGDEEADGDQDDAEEGDDGTEGGDEEASEEGDGEAGEEGDEEVVGENEAEPEEEDDGRPSGTVYAQVDYDGEWAMAFSTHDRTISVVDEGFTTFEIDDDPTVISVVAQKADDSADELTTRVMLDGDIVTDATTGEPFGIAQATHSFFDEE